MPEGSFIEPVSVPRYRDALVELQAFFDFSWDPMWARFRRLWVCREPGDTLRSVVDSLAEEVKLAQEAKNAPPAMSAPSRRPMSWVSRGAFLVCGLFLTVGFFLPWVIAGTALEFTGLGLVFTSGDVVQAISGSGRLLLFLVPLLGVALVLGAATGHRSTPWVAALGAGALLVFGVINVILLFVSSTGVGMWMVVFAALASLVVGVLSVGKRV